MAKMSTIKRLAVGTAPLGRSNEARIERNLFAENGHTFEALRFCKNRNGRHNRVHLVIAESGFVELFADAVRNQVLSEVTLMALHDILKQRLQTEPDDKRAPRGEPLLDIAGIFEDGTLTQGIDEALYGEHED